MLFIIHHQPAGNGQPIALMGITASAGSIALARYVAIYNKGLYNPATLHAVRREPIPGGLI